MCNISVSPPPPGSFLRPAPLFHPSTAPHPCPPPSHFCIRSALSHYRNKSMSSVTVLVSASRGERRSVKITEASASSSTNTRRGADCSRSDANRSWMKAETQEGLGRLGQEAALQSPAFLLWRPFLRCLCGRISDKSPPRIHGTQQALKHGLFQVAISPFAGFASEMVR